MTRSIFSTAAAALVALASGSGFATPTASLTLSVNQFGSTSHAVKSNASISVIANYQVTNLGAGQSVHIELDFCAPGANPSSENGGSARSLTGCTDGYGYNEAVTILSPTLSAGTGSTGVTGNFVVDVSTVPGLTYNGEAWSVPGRIVLDNSGGSPLANDTLAMTIVAAPDLFLYKQAVGTHDNGDGTTNVTWDIQLENPDSYAGTEPATGTTTISDPAASGGTFVSGARVGQTAITSVIPLWQTINPNSNASVSSAAGEAIITIDNLVTSSDGDLPSAEFHLVFRYPTGTAAHLVSNTASLMGPSGQTASAFAQTYVGPDSAGVAGTIAKGHYCPNSPDNAQTRTANLPNLYSNADCFWSPEYPLSYALTLTAAFSDTGVATTMTKGDVIDALAPETELAVLSTVDSAWHAFTSTDSSCSSSSSAWTAASQGQSHFSGVHCVRFTQVGASSPYGYTSFAYTVKLSSSQASTLEGEPGAYLFATNTATLTGDFVSVNGVGGRTASTSVTSTFWNTVAPMDSLTSLFDSSLSYTAKAAVGAAFDLTASLPFTSHGPILDTSGFHGLSFSGTLPTEIDLTGSPTGSPAYLDDQGTPTHLDCTWSAQNRSTTPVTPAKYRCQVVNAAGNAAFTPSITPGAPNPFTTSFCTQPDACQSSVAAGIYAGQNAGTPPIWNELGVTIPVVIVSGVAGQYITVGFNAWSTEGNTYPSGLAYAGTSETKPAIAQTTIGIAGVPQLKVQTTATSNNVVVGQDAVFNINYSNTGAVTTSGTYVYDIFGYDATTGASLTGYQNLNCTSAAPLFDGVTHISGTPSSVIEYTTDSPSIGIANLTWGPTAPSVLTTVTGVRFLLNSEFSQTAGDYGPSDQHGQEQLRFIAPNTPNSRLCSMAAIKATGLNLAGSIDLTSAEQIVTGTCTVNCNPVAHTPPTATINADGSCGASVTLDATGSTEATHFAWFEGTTLIASSDAPVFTATAMLRGKGQHGITLVASDALGIAAQASTIVTVVDHTAPVITCQASPGNVTLGSSCGTSTPAITATAVDACEGLTQTVCDIYQPGQTSVICTATDSSGNGSSCSVAVAVTGGPTAPSLTGGALDGAYTTLQGTQPDGNFCDVTLNDYIYFTWNPGCTNVDSHVTGTVTYVDSSGVTRNLYVNQTDASGVDAHGAQWGFISFQPPNDPVTGHPIDYVGPLTFTLHGTNGGSSSLVVQTGFELCACSYAQDNGQALILFEDLWPSNGDFDFNDAAVMHDFSFQTDGNSHVLTMRAQFNLVALGADIANGLYLHLPGLSAADVASMQIYTSDSQTPRNISVVRGESELVLQIAANTRDLFNGKPGFVNTAFGPVNPLGPAQTATATAKAVTVIINFTNPLSSYDLHDGSKFLDTSAAPYDLFLGRVGNYSHQIHQPQYVGTTSMDASLFNHVDDNSGSGLHFINRNNIPFALNMPGMYWPQETLDIGLLYPELIPYSEGILGTNNQNLQWYNDSSVVVGNGVHLADPTALPNAGPLLIDDRSGCVNHD